MKTRIQVLSVEKKSGRSKAGNDYNLTICQCVAHVVDEDGVQRVQVGELVLPKNHADVVPGEYEGEFGISVGADKRIGGRLLKLTAVARAASAPSASRPAA